MTPPAPPFNEFLQANAEWAQRYAHLAQEISTRVAGFQIDTFRRLCSAGSEQLTSLWPEGDQADFRTCWPGMWGKDVERTSEMARSLMHDTTRLTKEIAALVEKEVPPLNQCLAENMRLFLRPLPAPNAVAAEDREETETAGRGPKRRAA